MMVFATREEGKLGIKVAAFGSPRPVVQVSAPPKITPGTRKEMQMMMEMEYLKWWVRPKNQGGYSGFTYDTRQITHRRVDTGDPHRLGFASNRRSLLTGLITTSRESRHCPLVVLSGTLIKEAMASPVVKMGVSTIVMVIQHRMTILMMFEIMTTITNGRLYSTVHLSGTLSLRQYLTLRFVEWTR